MKHLLRRIKGFGFSSHLLKEQSELIHEIKFEPEFKEISMFQLISKEGKALNRELVSEKDNEILKSIYSKMRELELIDDFLNKAQRQGRVNIIGIE